VNSFSYVVADNSFGVKQKFKVDSDRDFYFDYKTIGRFFKIITVEELMSGKFDSNELDNKIVILGHTGRAENNFYLDHAKTKRISGVEIQASIVSQLINIE
jgi:CHASE2 domain-containing sensor protein